MAAEQLADFDAGTPNRMFSRCPGLNMAEAYELQRKVNQLREQRGERCIGYKIGCCSTAIQQQLGIHEPIYGQIFDRGCFVSGARLSHAKYGNLAIEGELAVRLAKDLSDPTAADESYLEAIESVFPVIELHDYVLRSPRPCCEELVASNGMHVGFVSAERTCAKARDRVQDLVIRITLRWLVAQVGQHGLRLARGQVILTGSPRKLYPVAPGCRVVVEAPPLGDCVVEIEN
jgi:2-keto-4-pentenoate hydratase